MAHITDEKVWDLGLFSNQKIFTMSGKMYGLQDYLLKFDIEGWSIAFGDFGDHHICTQKTVLEPYLKTKYGTDNRFWHCDGKNTAFTTAKTVHPHYYLGMWSDKFPTQLRDKSKQIFELEPRRLYLFDNDYWQHRKPKMTLEQNELRNLFRYWILV